MFARALALLQEVREEQAANRWLCCFLGLEIRAADGFRVKLVRYYRAEVKRPLTQTELRRLECTSRLSILRVELEVARLCLWDLRLCVDNLTDSLRHLQSALEYNQRRDFLLRSLQPDPGGPYRHEIEEWGSVFGERYVRIVKQYSRDPHHFDAPECCTTGIFSNQRNTGASYLALRDLSRAEVAEVCRLRLRLRLPRTLAWRPAPLPPENPWLQGENQGARSSSSSSS